MKLRRERPAGTPVAGRPDRSGLLARAQGGDALSLAVLRADLAPATAERLAQMLGVPGHDERGVVAAARAAEPDLLRRVLLVLLEDEACTPAAAAELLDVDVARAEQVLVAGRGVTAPCRGWLLVARAARLAGPEQDAALAHLASCRRCRATALAAGVEQRAPDGRDGSPVRA